MSERYDTAEVVEELRKIADELTGFQFIVVMRAAGRLQQLHDRLTAIDNANAERRALAEAIMRRAGEAVE